MSEATEFLKYVSEKIDSSYDELKKLIRELDMDIQKMNDYYWENYTEMDE